MRDVSLDIVYQSRSFIVKLYEQYADKKPSSSPAISPSSSLAGGNTVVTAVACARNFCNHRR